MNITKLMQIQSDLNNFTLSEKGVQILDCKNPSMGLGQREGTYLRHKSELVHLIDMYQWAGNREFLELTEVFGQLSLTDSSSNTTTEQNIRMEIVDVLHFDLSLLILTKVEASDIINLQIYGVSDPLKYLEETRKQFDNLQLRKWWTSNKVEIAEIRKRAIAQFLALINLATARASIFRTYDEIETAYLEKVKINYDRIKGNYDHSKKA